MDGGRGGRSHSRAAVALLLLAAGPPARAQIYQLEQEPVPEGKSLRTMYAFYVYSHHDAPEKTLGSPFVKFHSLVSHSTTPKKSNDEMKDYQGIQMSILPFTQFKSLIDMSAFCSTEDDVKQGLIAKPDQILVRLPENTKDPSDLNVYVHTVLFGEEHPKDVQVPVRMTGVYIFVWSNCGDFQDATVSGSVVVKNAYGFLPGNEYHKLPFYGWLSFFYILLALLWMGMCMYQWRQLFHIHYCIAAVIFLGLLEGFMWWIFFNDWNHSGLRGRFLFSMAILSSTVKSVFSYMLVLVASLGWGVTRPYLDHKTLLKVQAVSAGYIVLDFIRGAVLSFRHSHSLPMSFVLLCLLPVALLNGGIFYWIFTALSTLMETLKERRQVEKLALFEKLWRILIAALLIASCTLIFLMCDLSRSISIRWHYQWFLTDGVSHLLFLVVLMAMMFLWAPHSNSQRYAYSHPGKARDGDRKESGKDEWAAEDGSPGADDESFWDATHGETPKALKAVQGAGSAGEGA